MSNLKIPKQFFVGTILSVLIFFSISFITILGQISPLHYYKKSEAYELKLGFPFTYYNQFWVSGNNYPNSGWKGDYLLYDGFLTWFLVTGIYFMFVNRKRFPMNEKGVTDS